MHRINIGRYLCVWMTLMCALPQVQSQQIDQQAARGSLLTATEFLRNKLVNADGISFLASDRLVTVPRAGLAFLHAHEATGEDVYLAAAKDAADILIRGQLRSGGWSKAIDFSDQRTPFRIGQLGGQDKVVPIEWPSGWDVWRKRRFKNNTTVVESDATPSAIRFLAKLDQRLRFSNAGVHDAAIFAIESAVRVQYPNGAWGGFYDRYPTKPPSHTRYPSLRAAFPGTRDPQPKSATACYRLESGSTLRMIDTMLMVAEIYNDERYWYSARKGGEFLLFAQMPSPQAGWSQHYDHVMEPLGDVDSAQPCISSETSQDVLQSLVTLHQAFGDDRFAKSADAAIAYLRDCPNQDGRLAVFYELGTNRPLGTGASGVFACESRLDDLHGQIRRDRTSVADSTTPRERIQRLAQGAISSQNADGGWRREDRESPGSVTGFFERFHAICRVIER